MKTVQDNTDLLDKQLREHVGLDSGLNHSWRNFRKFRPKYYSHKMMSTGWALRTLTAAILMMMMVLTPISVNRSLAAPTADPQESMGALVELGESGDVRQTRGESRLTKRQRAQLLAWSLLRRAKAAEPLVTADMKELEQDSAQLQGLDYRIKAEDSLVRKILSDADAQQISLDQAAADISDVLRYTLICQADDYSRDVPKAVEQLTKKGYTMEKFRNAWGGKFYQGVNVHLVSPSGVRVELQFHTPQSFEIKQASHEVYEIRRSPSSTPEQVAEATRRSLEYNAQVVVPKGAESISWPKAA